MLRTIAPVTSLLLATSALVVLAGCGSHTQAENTAESTHGLLKRHACDVPGLTPAQIAECIAWITDETHDPPYCADQPGQPGYDCENFSNTFCDGAGNYNVGCLGALVSCSDGSAHAFNVIYIGGQCVAVEPQTGETLGTWPPTAGGSCAPRPVGAADNACAGHGGATVGCAGRGDIPEPGDSDGKPCVRYKPEIAVSAL
jgi:hypothetical protein